LASPLSLYDHLFLWFFYFARSLRFDLPENQVGWRSRQNQELRFRSITEIGDLKGTRILDLGCGLGCLYAFLREQGWEGEYTGMDLLSLMVKRARWRFPGVEFEKRDLLRQPTDRKWDYVLINGVFNHRVSDNWAWMEQLVKAAWALCDKGVGFNVLSSGSGWKDPELFYADPRVLETKAAQWTDGNSRVVAGHLPEDLTVYFLR